MCPPQSLLRPVDQLQTTHGTANPTFDQDYPLQYIVQDLRGWLAKCWPQLFPVFGSSCSLVLLTISIGFVTVLRACSSVFCFEAGWFGLQNIHIPGFKKKLWKTLFVCWCSTMAFLQLRTAHTHHPLKIRCSFATSKTMLKICCFSTAKKLEHCRNNQPPYPQNGISLRSKKQHTIFCRHFLNIQEPKEKK